jgi:DNA helicase-2/ATP-dependent DNA helicase PcrA
VDQNLVVIDYKSGNPDSITKKLKAPANDDEIGGHYWRQMVFYDLLLEVDPKIKRGMTSGYILALEPKKDGSLVQKNIHITEEHRVIVKNQILDTWQKIQNLEFEKGCGECAWCKMHDLNPPIIEQDENADD